MARDQQMSSQIQSNVVERMEETTSGSSLRPRNPHDYESDAKTKKPSKRTLFTSIASDMPMTAAAAMTTASTSTTVMQPHKASSNNDSSDTGGGSGAASGYHLTQDVVVTRPFLRGKIHLFLLLVSPFWMFLIFSVCSSPRSFIAAAVSCFSFVLNFLASTLLHCFEWKNPTLHQIFHKLDHAGRLRKQPAMGRSFFLLGDLVMERARWRGVRMVFSLLLSFEVASVRSPSSLSSLR